ncbi:carboxymuconolactone decarboxylase family protein [Methanosphaera sp. WGK6]|uniref:carboxymuconolactone decarboxylase family protein n=1 Tax=Methanosphaera sp. WGK6 TaxID=1561964 RepID=UPI00084C8A48|nr:carboxymuconolactone decarboxylase family protein [Methanosphaera sp. WGK6]
MSDRYTESRKIYKELFGQLPNESEEQDHEFMEILRRFIFGDVFHTGNLEMKTRELLTITCLATMQTLPQLSAHINAGLNTGATPIEIREAIYQLAPFIGFPKTLNAINIMNEVFTSRNIELPLKDTSTVDDSNRYEQGLEIQSPLYGDEMKKRYEDYPETATFLTEFCFGDFYTRDGLSVKQRELLIFAVLATLNLTAQLKPHALGNIKVGNSKETLYYAMLQCMPYIGFPNAASAINVIKNLE